MVVASCGPRENNSGARGARSTYCAVALAAISHGRFLMTPKLRLFGAKLRSRAALGDKSAMSKLVDGNSTADPDTLFHSIRPASCTFIVLDNFNSLNM